MGLLIFLSTIIALSILSTPFLKNKKIRWWIFGTIFIISIIITSNGLYQSCKDGWSSRSIGNQGACSWHGGVVTMLNDFGQITLIVSSTIIVISFLFWFLKLKKIEKIEKKDNQKICSVK